MLSLLTIGAALTLGGIEFQLDPNQSSFDATLCILQNCETDSSTLSGTIRAAIECPDAPRAISFEGFTAQVDENLAWVLDYGFLGKITVNASGLKMTQTGDPTPFAPVVGGNFEVADVPVKLEGVVTYKATGLVCETLKNMGRACEDTVDLGEQEGVMATLAGRIEVDATTIRLAADFDEVILLDPEQPDLGTLHIVGQMRANADRPDTSVVKSFKSKCKKGSLTSKLKLADDRLSGTDAVVAVNGERFATPIKGAKAKLKLAGRAGSQEVRLVDPPNCETPKTVDCG